MIRDDAKIIVTPTGVSLKEVLIEEEVVKALNGESYIFSRRIEIPKDEEQIKEIKLEYRKRIIIHRIHNLNLNDYPLEVLEKVYIELGGN